MGKVAFILPSRWHLADIYRLWFNSVFTCSKEADQGKCFQQCCGTVLPVHWAEPSHGQYVLVEGSKFHYGSLHLSQHWVPSSHASDSLIVYHVWFMLSLPSLQGENSILGFFCHRYPAVLKYFTGVVILFILYRGTEVPRLKFQSSYDSFLLWQINNFW